MENTTIQELHEKFVEVEGAKEKLESAILIAGHLIDETQDLSGLDPVANEMLIKLRGVYCIMDKVRQELDSSVLQADELVFCRDEETKKGIKALQC